MHSRRSTFAAAVAIGGVAMLAVALIRGDDGAMGLWFYGTGFAIIGGFASAGLALRQAGLVPRWRWIAESLIGGVAIVTAIAAAVLVLR